MFVCNSSKVSISTLSIKIFRTWDLGLRLSVNDKSHLLLSISKLGTEVLEQRSLLLT